MRIGMIGLGRMGANMTRRLARGGAQVAAFDVDEGARDALRGTPGVVTADSLAALIEALPAPRVIWLMLPAGAVTQSTLDTLHQLISAGDTLVDGANAYYRDAVDRARDAGTRGVHFVDAGVSGGIWGLDSGYAMMLGGSDAAVAAVTPFVRILAPTPDTGWLHCGPIGAGHFVKMVHNGIEYGMMQAMAEGFALMGAKDGMDLDLAAIAQSWRHASVVRSWLLDLTADALARDAVMESVQPVVADSGEGRWTVLESVELGVPTPVMTLALMNRFGTQGKGDYAAKLLATMRNMFGGHALTRNPAD